MIVAVTGGRNFEDVSLVRETLKQHPITLLVHGGCTDGADRIAQAWAKETGTPEAIYPAHFTVMGRKAGPMRNDWMLRFSKPDLLIAFPGGDGTADCIAVARQLGIMIREVQR